MPGMDKTGRQQVAERVAEELSHRGWNPSEVYRRGGVDQKTLQKVLDGLAIRSDSRRRLTDLFEWPPDAFERIARGEDPAPPPPDGGAPPWDQLLAGQREIVSEQQALRIRLERLAELLERDG